jgi:hypothetical protein
MLGRPVDVLTEHGLKPRIRERVLKEAIEVWGIQENASVTCWKP